jgi:hypothetical protein
MRQDRVFLRRSGDRTVRGMSTIEIDRDERERPVARDATEAEDEPITEAMCRKAELDALLRTWNYSY